MGDDAARFRPLVADGVCDHHATSVFEILLIRALACSKYVHEPLVRHYSQHHWALVLLIC